VSLLLPGFTVFKSLKSDTVVPVSEAKTAKSPSMPMHAETLLLVQNRDGSLIVLEINLLSVLLHHMTQLTSC
jgi:hypothetical protein